MQNTHFQYCPKLAVFDTERSSVFLCRRKGELDYDGVFSFIGGKMEHTDASITECLKREKSEEVGNGFMLRVLPHYSVDVFFQKKDGNRMILPHFYAEHVRGDPVLNEEYSEYAWVPLAELITCRPMIENIAWIAPLLLRVGILAAPSEFVEV